MRLLLLILLAVFASVAHAQAMHGFTFTWVEPTARVDGQVIDPATEIASYRMRCEGAEIVNREITRGASSPAGEGERTFQWEGAVQRGGWYDCRMIAVDTDGLASEWSEVAQVRKLAQPNPPGLRSAR